jgi:pimeloyl-ACP methyl ester carboxylesterase
MRIAFRASWCRHVLGLALAGVILPLATTSPPARADLIFFKDGFALEGRVKREMTLEFDKVGGEMYHMPRGFFFLDDGPRRIFFSPSQVRLVFPKDPPAEERIVCPDKRIQVNAKNLPDLLEVVKAPEWDDKWNRRFQFRCPTGLLNVPQHIGLLTPHWARVDSPGKYFWSCAYLTGEFEPEMVRRLLASHADFQDRKDQAPVQRVSRRLRKADFYAQAGWFDFAEQELDGILVDMPEQKDRALAARKALHKLRARDNIEKIKRRHLASQHQWVRKRLADFDAKELPERMIAELEELKADYETTDRLLKEASRLIDQVRQAASGANSGLLAKAAAEILEELNFENVGRLDAFLGQARQAERFQKKGVKSTVTADQLLSLAVSGWLLGSASAEMSPETATRLWHGRDMVRAYLRSSDPAEQKALLHKHQAGSRTEAASLDELIQIIRTLPPVEAEKKLPEGIDERKAEGANYLLQLPPEYRHSRPTPVLIVLHQAGDSPRDMLNRWSDAAAENGYLLAAPTWQPGGLTGNTYTYSERDHAVVLNTLRDLKRHFNVDEDRVFLFGLGEGGAMAFDVGLGHPDLFAGVLPMAAGPQYHAALCWRNGQYLPFYVVHGNRGPNGDKIRQQFEVWVQRNFPMLWVDYKGRGVEWFAGEVPLMFDWMRSKKRYFPKEKLGTSGGGGMFGNEFCTLRACDNHFYWLSTNDVRNTNSAEHWKVGVQPASLTAVINIHDKVNSIILNATGVGQVTIWLGRNAKGEDMIDFDKPVTVTVGINIKVNQRKVAPSVETMLEDLHQRGDRQQLFLAKIPLDLKR